MAWRYDGGIWNGLKSTTHSSCFDRHSATELVAIYDPDKKSCREFSESRPSSRPVKIAESLDDFFSAKLDLVSICSPNEYHFTHIIRCLEQKIPLLWVEKPVTIEMEDYRQIREKVRKADAVPRISVNYFRRNMSQFKYLIDKVKKRTEPCVVELNYSRNVYVNGVHMIDLLGACLEARDAPEFSWLDMDDPLHPNFGMTNGDVSARIFGYDLSYHAIEMRAIFSNKRISVLRGGLEVWIEDCVENIDYPGFYHLDTPRLAYAEEIVSDKIADGTYLNLCNLVDTDAGLESSLESAYFTQDVLNKIVVQ